MRQAAEAVGPLVHEAALPRQGVYAGAAKKQTANLAQALKIGEPNPRDILPRPARPFDEFEEILKGLRRPTVGNEPIDIGMGWLR